LNPVCYASLPSLESLAGKFANLYKWSEALELLAYVEPGELAHQGAEEMLPKRVGDLLAGSEFTRVWIL
jgi:hypothetical protein